MEESRTQLSTASAPTKDICFFPVSAPLGLVGEEALEIMERGVGLGGSEMEDEEALWKGV